MGRILFCVVIAVLACGCRWKAQPHAPGAPNGITLPEAISGKPIEKPTENDVLLNVGSNGEVIPPSERLGNPKPLASIAELEDYLRQRADTEKMQTSKGNPEGLPLLRIDRDTPFEKTYPILKACHTAGYAKARLRVLQPESIIETQLPLSLYRTPDILGVPDVADPGRYVVRIDTDDNAQITAFTFRVDGDPEEAGERLGAELPAYETKLRTVATNEARRTALAEMQRVRIPPPQLTLELPEKLLHGSVVKVLDTALQAGFVDVWLLPIDPAKR